MLRPLQVDGSMGWMDNPEASVCLLLMTLLYSVQYLIRMDDGLMMMATKTAHLLHAQPPDPTIAAAIETYTRAPGRTSSTWWCS